MTPLLGAETESRVVRGKDYKFVADKDQIAFEEADEADRTKPLHNVVLQTGTDLEPH